MGLMPDTLIRCRFDLNHEVFPCGFYDVRWFRADDRGKLDNHPGAVPAAESPHRPPDRICIAEQSKIGPKALPISDDEIQPRRLAPEVVASRGRDQATQSGTGPLAFGRELARRSSSGIPPLPAPRGLPLGLRGAPLILMIMPTRMRSFGSAPGGQPVPAAPSCRAEPHVGASAKRNRILLFEQVCQVHQCDVISPHRFLPWSLPAFRTVTRSRTSNLRSMLGRP